MKNIPYVKKNNLKGFSFAETILATFVLSVGLLSVVKVFQVSVSQSLLIREATVASELVQEGVELVRNVRDTDFIDGGTGFTKFTSGVSHCYISVNAPTLHCFANQSDTSRYSLNFQNNQYESTNGNGKFQRYIYIDSRPAITIVRSFVTWNGNLTNATVGRCTIRNKCSYTESRLTNWKS